jgi:NAD(P)H-dependent FMN reductase
VIRETGVSLWSSAAPVRPGSAQASPSGSGTRLRRKGPLQYELIDLAEINLPFLDEPLKAGLRQYEHEHTRAWSELISGYDGFLFVFPQYNWGYPAPPKNALDFLYYE